MVMLVTLQQAKDHLRVDTDDGDSDLSLKIEAASGAVLNYIRSGADIFLDSTGEPALDSNGGAIGIPREVQQATLLLLGYFYRDRDADSEKAYEMGYLPRPVTALLYPHRDPVVR